MVIASVLIDGIYREQFLRQKRDILPGAFFLEEPAEDKSANKTDGKFFSFRIIRGWEIKSAFSEITSLAPDFSCPAGEFCEKDSNLGIEVLVDDLD